MKNFAVTGVAGYVAPRHLQAIVDTGNRIVAACDPHDSVGLLDKYSFEISFFTEFERFDRHLEKLKRGKEADRVHYVSICSPNYLHDAHVRLALRIGADAICEKPLVINPWNLDALLELERETGRRVYNVLQLRGHPGLIDMRDRVHQESRDTIHDVCLTYVTARGRWYDTSWKGSEERSGGIITNLGIHFFDLLIWLFGAVEHTEVHLREHRRAAGFMRLKRARVRWFLSIEPDDLALAVPTTLRTTFRSIKVDGRELEFSEGFASLHTRVYEDILRGAGPGIDETRPAIDLAYRIRRMVPELVDSHFHPPLTGRH